MRFAISCLQNISSSYVTLFWIQWILKYYWYKYWWWSFFKVKKQKFNFFYTTIVDTFVSKLPSCVNNFGSSFVFNYYSSKGVKPDSVSFSTVSESGIFKYLYNLSSHKATGLDWIPARIVKDVSSIYSGPLCLIANLSIIQGVVPDDLKSARVVPLYRFAVI